MWELAENRDRCCASLYCISSCAPHLIDCTPYKQALVTIVIYPFRFLSHSLFRLSLSLSLCMYMCLFLLHPSIFQLIMRCHEFCGTPKVNHTSESFYANYERVTSRASWSSWYTGPSSFEHNLFQETIRFFKLNFLVRNNIINRSN